MNASTDNTFHHTLQLPAEMLRQCWFLAGPTACGKTEVGLWLAEQLQAEIVAMDSMSLYRGMDIGTAKPSRQQRRQVRHHLIDILEPHDEFSLAEYVAAARSACEAIFSRNRPALFVGGTGLYLRSLLRGVFNGPPADWDFRRQLEAEAKQREAGHLHRRVQQVDPSSAAKLHPNDTRRLIRALEVHRLTGRPLSHWQQQEPLPDPQRPRTVFWLAPPRRWLYERINARVEAMMADGLVEEVRALLAEGHSFGHTARQALGYKEILDALQEGRDPREATELIQRRTRQFAKRQHTWFRNLPEAHPVAMTGEESPEQLARQVLDVEGRTGND